MWILSFQSIKYIEFHSLSRLLKYTSGQANHFIFSKHSSETWTSFLCSGENFWNYVAAEPLNFLSCFVYLLVFIDKEYWSFMEYWPGFHWLPLPKHRSPCKKMLVLSSLRFFCVVKVTSCRNISNYYATNLCLIKESLILNNLSSSLHRMISILNQRWEVSFAFG